MVKILIRLLVILLLLPVAAVAQSIPNGTITQGQIWSPTQWNNAWKSKIDAANGTANNTTFSGGVFTGTFTGTPHLSNNWNFDGGITGHASLDLPLAGGTVTGATTLSAPGVALALTGTGAMLMPAGTTGQQPDTGNAGEARYNATTGRFEFGVGGSWINHVRLSGDTMAGALHMGANTIDGSAAAFTGGTMTGLTWSGGTLSGTIAGTPTVSGNWNFSGGLTGTLTGGASLDLPLTGGTLSGSLNIGNNSTAKTLNLNGPVGSGTDLRWSQANVLRQQIQTDSSARLQFRAFDSSGANQQNWLTIAATTGLPTFNLPTTFADPIQLNPQTITVSGSDIGTPLSSMMLSGVETITGSSTTSTIFTANQITFNDNLATANSQTHWMMTMYFLPGGTNYDGGTTGLFADMSVLSDMPNLTNTGVTFMPFQPKIVANNNAATALSAEALNPTCGVATSTNWIGGCIAMEIDYSVADDASPAQSTSGLFLSLNSRNLQQGWVDSSMLRMGSTTPGIVGHNILSQNAIKLGLTQWPVDQYNGAILTTEFQLHANTDATAMTPIAAPLGLDLSNVATSDSIMRWAGGNHLQNSKMRLGFLSITQGASGPVIDADRQCVVGTPTWVSGSGDLVGEQISDRFGGNLVIDTLTSSHLATSHWANGTPPCVTSGQDLLVNRAMTISPSAGTVLNSPDIWLETGDTVQSPNAAVDSATTISSLVTNHAFVLGAVPTAGGTVLTVSGATNATDGGNIDGMCITPGSNIASHTSTTITLSLGLVNPCTSVIGHVYEQRPLAILSKSLIGTLPANTEITMHLTGIPANPITMIGGSGSEIHVNYTWAPASTMQIGASVNTIIGTGAALATSATVGFPMIPTTTGAPTGTVGGAGQAALVVRTDNHKLCHSEGAGTWYYADGTPCT